MTELVELAGLAGLGTAQLGSGPGWAIDWGRNDPAEAKAVIRAAVDAGVPLALTAATQQLVEGCIAQGMGDLDLSALLPRLEREAGVHKG